MRSSVSNKALISRIKCPDSKTTTHQFEIPNILHKQLPSVGPQLAPGAYYPEPSSPIKAL